VNRPQIDRCLATALADRRLLRHPFLPGFLTRLQASLPEGPARDLVAANLADELGDPIPHTELFERFATAVDAEAEPPSSATKALLDTYNDLLDESPVGGLAGFLAYESQAAEVATTKAAGLRRHHRLDDHQVSFWEHHSKVESDHAEWLADALSKMATTEDGLATATRRAADAWWSFLDEREAAGIR
jgi:pyrroloquinoline quinone (PQQ) biosynthesis protein C